MLMRQSGTIWYGQLFWQLRARKRDGDYPQLKVVFYEMQNDGMKKGQGAAMNQVAFVSIYAKTRKRRTLTIHSGGWWTPKPGRVNRTKVDGERVSTPRRRS